MLRITSRRQKYHQQCQCLKLQSSLIFPTDPSSSSDKHTGLRKSCHLNILLLVEGEGYAISSTCIIFWSVVPAGTGQTLQSQVQKEKWCDCVSMHGSGWHWILKFSCWSLLNQYHLRSLCCLKIISTSTVLTHSDTSLVTTHKSIWRVSANGWVSSLLSGIWKCSLSVHPLISKHCLYFLNCDK